MLYLCRQHTARAWSARGRRGESAQIEAMVCPGEKAINSRELPLSPALAPRYGGLVDALTVSRLLEYVLRTITAMTSTRHTVCELSWSRN